MKLRNLIYVLLLATAACDSKSFVDLNEAELSSSQTQVLTETGQIQGEVSNPLTQVGTSLVKTSGWPIIRICSDKDANERGVYQNNWGLDGLGFTVRTSVQIHAVLLGRIQNPDGTFLNKVVCRSPGDIKNRFMTQTHLDVKGLLAEMGCNLQLESAVDGYNSFQGIDGNMYKLVSHDLFFFDTAVMPPPQVNSIVNRDAVIESSLTYVSFSWIPFEDGTAGPYSRLAEVPILFSMNPQNPNDYYIQRFQNTARNLPLPDFGKYDKDDLKLCDIFNE